MGMSSRLKKLERISGLKKPKEIIFAIYTIDGNGNKKLYKKDYIEEKRDQGAKIINFIVEGVSLDNFPLPI
jgi:hypothetical protein